MSGTGNCYDNAAVETFFNAPTPEELLKTNRAKPQRTITYKGETLTIDEWSVATGIPATTIKGRIANGWNIQRVLTQPIQIHTSRIDEQGRPKPRRKRGTRFTYSGKTHTVREWSKITGIDVATINYRLRKGWSPERALSEPISVSNSRKAQRIEGPGVVSNFGASKGTGGGTSAQDTSKITFSEREAS
ncbi:conserved hypothetical protein [Rhodobacteraceae bacterium KLH11]|nr:conserved hypothetical protein [Rhodobacteraceae bacterium KLH11]